MGGVGRTLPVLKGTEQPLQCPASPGGHLVVHTSHLHTFAHPGSMFIQPVVTKTLQCAHHMLVGSGSWAVSRTACVAPALARLRAWLGTQTPTRGSLWKDVGPEGKE